MGKTKERAWRNSDTHIWKKQKTPTQTSKSPFRSDDAEKRYNKFTSKRTLFMERGFAWSETNPLVTQIIKSHKWETFCLNPSPASIPLVREFYANYDSTRPDKVYVRGKLVDITSSAINYFFSLTNHQNTFFENASSISSVTGTDILNELTEPGADLTRGLTNDVSFSQNHLKAGAKIWIEFIKHSLVPSCHDTVVEKDIEVLLYCIMVGKPINVGKVIAKQIEVCAGLNKGELWFPDFITRLCKRDNVFLADQEPVQQPYSPLTFESEIDQEMRQSDNECSSSPVTNLAYDDGDEELLESVEEPVKNSDVNLEPLESVENVSSMSDCAQSVEQGENLVGSRIKVWWAEDETYQEGVVKSFNSRIKKHEVLYDFGAEELLILRQEQWELIENVSPVSDCAQSVEHGENLVESSIKVSSSVTNIEHEGTVKSIDCIKKSHESSIDVYDDGDEELLDVKREPCELVKNVSPMSDCLQSGIICVHGYKVKQSVAPVLESIFKKHGDIAAECVFKSVSVRSSLLEVICEVVRQIQTDSITEITKEIECQLSDAEAANINVSWIRAHFEGIRKRKEGMKKPSLLMETKGTTILVKKAAQMDLREISEELLSAQERFVKAERCVRVLDLVEKKLSINILESKAEKDSWVEQPIL